MNNHTRSKLHLAITLWDALGDDLMLEAFNQRSNQSLTSWKLHTGPVTDDVDVMHLNGKTYVRCRQIHTEAKAIHSSQIILPNEVVKDTIFFCPYCQERAFPESDCIACTTFVCGSDPDHTFLVRRPKRK